jgi:hypothetical protein
MLSVTFYYCCDKCAECSHDECRLLNIIMPSAVMLSIVMSNAVMLNVVMQKAPMLHYVECHYVECRYTECRVANIFGFTFHFRSKLECLS